MQSCFLTFFLLFCLALKSVECANTSIDWRHQDYATTRNLFVYLSDTQHSNGSTCCINSADPYISCVKSTANIEHGNAASYSYYSPTIASSTSLGVVTNANNSNSYRFTVEYTPSLHVVPSISASLLLPDPNFWRVQSSYPSNAVASVGTWVILNSVLTAPFSKPQIHK